MNTLSDMARTREVLADVERSATELSWAEERPWRLSTHVFEEHGVVVIDLHDLNASLSKRVLACLRDLGPDLEGGGAIFITGRGRHSVGLPVLRRIVVGTLVRLERERGWRQRDLGAGRVLMVVDEARIPARFRGQMPLWIPAFFVVFAVALVWALPLEVGVPLLVFVGWFALGVWRASRPKAAPDSTEE